MVTSIDNPQTMGRGFRDANSVPQYNTPTGRTTPQQDTAANLGYSQGKSTPLGLVPGYNFVKGPLGLGKNDTFGNPNTTDARGNVFDSTGRAWDPITGRAVPSYKDAGSGFNTLKTSYGKLRDAGEGVIGSALGSYDNSIYRQMDQNPGMSKTEAKTARLRGEGAPINTIAGRVGSNTAAASSPEDFFMSETSMNTSMKPVSPYDLGFDGSRSTTVDSTTGVFGSGPGDIVGLSGNQMGVLSPSYRDNQGKLQSTGSNDGDRVNIQSPTGTLVSITDSVTGESINATTMSPQLRAELERREGNKDRQRKDVNKAYDMTRAEEEGDLDDGSGGK